MNSDFDSYRLPDEHEALREAVRALAEKEIAPHAAEVDEEGRYPVEARKALNKAGFQAITIPEEYGGEGADELAGCIVIEEVARVCAASSLIPAVNKLGLMPILLSGSDELKRQVFPSIASGEAMICYALSEREAGSDAAAMRTRARRDGDDWVLNGTKCWITNAGVSSWYTVMAVTDPEREGQGHFRVRGARRRPGLRHRAEGTQARHQGLADPGDLLRGLPDPAATGSSAPPGTGFRTAMGTLDHTRPTIGAQAMGIAQGALDVAIDYVKERSQFGKQLAEFQGLQFMIADMAMKMESARQLVYVAAAAAERGDANLGFMSSAAKCLATDVAMAVTIDAVQLLGGAGYTRDFPVERMMRDAKITQIYEGTNQVQRLVMARSLLR